MLKPDSSSGDKMYSGMEIRWNEKPRVRFAIRVPLDEMESKAEWVAQRIVSMSLFIFIFMTVWALTVAITVYLATDVSPQMKWALANALFLMGCLLILMGALYGIEYGLAGTKEERRAKWDTLPRWKWSTRNRSAPN